MKLLVIGSGAREHALVWKLQQNPQAEIYVAPGNAGTGESAHNVDIAFTNLDALANTAEKLKVDLTIVGPEAPLALGITDLFRKRGLAVFGPSKAAAQIESSKAFSRRLMEKYGVPCAQGAIFSSFDEAKKYVLQHPLPLVVKADGLAAGKGVIIAHTASEALDALSDIMVKKIFGTSGDNVIIEECLTGKEVSLISFTDGKTIVPMVPACDYKRIFDNDLGPNTGGMGSYSPPGFFDKKLWDITRQTILEPTLQAMAQEKIPYQGVLYVGIMLTSAGPRVLEYNARFGDPETQAILPRLETDLASIFLAIINGTLNQIDIRWSDDVCIGVVLASAGYPGNYKTGFTITGLNNMDKDIMVFHAGTKREANRLVTAGGRVLTVTATGKNMTEASQKVYSNISRIQFPGCQYRKDIAAREI